jgi:hypothetical protein
MKTSTMLLCLMTVAVGLVVLAWPEQNDQMMIQLNDAHGPSMLDLVGLAIIMLGYLPFLFNFIHNLKSVIALKGKRTVMITSMAVFDCLILIGIGLFLELDWLLWIGVAGAVSAQVVLFYFSYAAERTTR